MSIRTPARATLNILIGLILAGCATPTISNNINILALEPGKIGNPSLSGLYLIGGKALDFGNKIICKEDGSCALFGHSFKSFGETTDYFAAIISPDHQLLWARTYGGTNKDVLRTAIATSDGGYLLLGSSQSLFFTGLKVISPSRPERPFLLKIDGSGIPQWAVTIDIGAEFVFDVIQMHDGNYVLVGGAKNSTSTALNWDVVVIKLSNSGDQIWANYYDLGYNDVGYGIVEESKGNLVITGYTKPDVADGDTFVLKLNSNGAPLWSKVYQLEHEQVPLSLLEDEDGSYLLVGNNKDGRSKKEIFAARVSQDGGLIWFRSYRGADDGEVISMIKGYHGDFLLVGRTGNVKDRHQDGAAILINNTGQLKSVVLVNGNTFVDGDANVELMSASKFSLERYLLFGDTEHLKPSDVDMVFMTWNSLNSDLNNSKSGFIQRDLKIKERETQVKAMQAQLRHTAIPVSQIEIKTLSVGKLD